QASAAVVNGRPAFAWYALDSSNNSHSLWYVRAIDSPQLWSSKQILASSGSGSIGSPASLTMVNGQPAAAFFTPLLRDFRFKGARDTDGTGSWGAEFFVEPPPYTQPPPFVPLNPSMKIVNGRPAVSYSRGTLNDL